jgi:hypothetical protein
MLRHLQRTQFAATKSISSVLGERAINTWLPPLSVARRRRGYFQQWVEGREPDLVALSLPSLA